MLNIIQLALARVCVNIIVMINIKGPHVLNIIRLARAKGRGRGVLTSLMTNINMSFSKIICKPIFIGSTIN